MAGHLAADARARVCGGCAPGLGDLTGRALVGIGAGPAQVCVAASGLQKHTHSRFWALAHSRACCACKKRMLCLPMCADKVLNPRCSCFRVTMAAGATCSALHK
jgi:hypothetical protein